MRRIVGAVCVAALLSGCATSLSTRPVNADQTATLVGIPYHLPALAYDIEVTRSLSECSGAGAELVAHFDVGAKVTPRIVAGERFVADYRALASWNKTSALKIETWPNQTLKAVNAEAVDKSPEIIQGVVTAGFNIARVAAGLPAAETGGATPQAVSPPVPPYTCPQALALANTYAAGLKRLTKQSEALNQALKPLVAESLIGTLTPKDKAKISSLRAKLAELDPKITGATDQLAEQQKLLTTTETLTFTPTASEPGKVWVYLADADPQTTAAQMAWMKALFGYEPAKDLAAQAATMLSVAARFTPDAPVSDVNLCSSSGLDAGCGDIKAPEWARKPPSNAPGLVFRTPVTGELRVCEGRDAVACRRDAKVLAARRDAAAQLGAPAILPFRNGFGENNALQAQFREDGSLDWASYDSKAAPGESAVKAVNGALDADLAYQAQLRAKHDAEAKAAADAATAQNAAATAALDQQIAMLTKEAQVRELEAAADPTRIEGDRTLAALNAQIAQLQAQKSIRELQAAVGQ